MAGHRGRSDLKAKALSWLAQRDHSRQELGDKLARWQARASHTQDTEADPGAAGDESDESQQRQRVERVLDELVSRGLLSDARFAESRVHARQTRFGNRRIESELHRLGVAPSPETLEALRDSEIDRARRVLLSRFASLGQTPLQDRREQARRQRFLAGRGFSGETIRAVLREPASED